MRVQARILAVAICVALNMPAHAQQTIGAPEGAAPEAQPAELDSIVVTSTKREELMRDVPVAISVVSAEDIDTAGLDSAADIAPMVPGFVMVPLFGSSGYNPVIRGLSTTIGEPNVGFFIDGVYMPSRAGLDFMLGDNIQRVEVARGPQYALYGRNTFAGAVNFITRPPGSDRKGSVLIGFGSDGGRKAKATISGPIIDNRLYYRAGVSARDSDGQYENELTGGRLDWSRRRSGFLTLNAYPTDHFDGQLSLIYEKLSDGDVAQRYISNNAGFVARFNDRQQFFGNVPILTEGFAVTPGHFNRDNLIASLSLHYDMDFAKLTSVTAYNRLKLDQLYDSDYSAVRIAEAGTSGTQKQFSQEFNLASQGERRIDWLAGVYHYDFEDRRDDISRFIAAAAPLGGVLSDNRERTRSSAVFGQATWHITDRWGLGLAMRYTTETKSVDVTQVNLPSAINPAGSTQNINLSSKFEPFTPGLYLTYKATPDATFYANAVRAVKVGGFNTVITNGAITPAERSYDAERSMNYEVGGKFSLLDGRMFLDTGAYMIKWDDQIVRSIGLLGATLNVNAGKTTSKGIETSLEFHPTPEWTLRGGGSYNSAVYDEYIFPLVGAIGGDPDLSGKRLQYGPAYTANFSALNKRTLDNGWQWFTRTDMLFRTSMIAVQTGTARIPGSTRFNLHTGLRKNHLEFTIWVNNLLNDKAPASAVFISSPATIFESATRQRPGRQLFQPLVSAPELRSFGIEVSYDF